MLACTIIVIVLSNRSAQYFAASLNALSRCCPRVVPGFRTDDSVHEFGVEPEAVRVGLDQGI